MKLKKFTIKSGTGFGFFDPRLLKKNYCCKCGTKLLIKYPQYYILKESILYYKKLYFRDFYYYCCNCDYYIKYKNQREISKTQRENCLVQLEGANGLISKYQVKFTKNGEELCLSSNK